jgi:hypothetical protein
MTMDFNPRPINTKDSRVVGTAPRFDFEKEVKDGLRNIFGNTGPASSPSSSQFASNQNRYGNGNTDGTHHQDLSSTLQTSALSPFYQWSNDPMREPPVTFSPSAMMLPPMVAAWSSSSASSSSSSSLAAQAWTFNSAR